MLHIFAAFLLAGEPVAFDDAIRPRFTKRQIAGSSASTRAGFEKWAATGEGRRLISRFRTTQYEVIVIEDDYEPAPGRAPQPGLATFLAAGDAKKTKRYDLILNPYLADQYSAANALRIGRPVTPADVMAAAWAGEMLHIELYADGVRLPHHERDDFQQRWLRVAIELGFPAMRHHTDHFSGPPL